jgi:hypothetical protein
MSQILRKLALSNEIFHVVGPLFPKFHKMLSPEMHHIFKEYYYNNFNETAEFFSPTSSRGYHVCTVDYVGNETRKDAVVCYSDLFITS